MSQTSMSIPGPARFAAAPVLAAASLCWFAATAPALATELLIVEIETDQVDLDTAQVHASGPGEESEVPGADIRLRYNADRSPHAVVAPVGEGVEIAFVAGVGFDGVNVEDLADLSFSSQPVDLAFTADSCIVIRTDQGSLYKLGNASESGMSVSFNYTAL